MANGVDLGRLRDEAWVGDAVLSLYAREHILREDGSLDAAKASRMTSNQFLSAFGEPTSVEARIGRVYQAQGLNAAFAWIEGEILPLFLKQEARRTQAQPASHRRKPMRVENA